MFFQSNVEKKAYDLSRLKKEILSASADGETIYTLLRMAHSALQADIGLCSTSLLILCIYPENQESFYFTHQGNTLLPSAEGVQDFLTSGIPERIVANPDEPFTARYHDTQLIHLYCGIRIKNTLAAYLCVVWDSEDIPAEISDFVTFLCHVLSLKMQNNGYSGISFLAKELILENLVQHRHEQMLFALNLFPDLMGAAPYTYRLCSVRRRGCEHSVTDLLAFRDQFLQLYPGAIAYLHDSTLYCLVAEPGPDAERLLLQLRSFLRSYHFVMACSNPIHSLARMQTHLCQLRSLMMYHSNSGHPEDDDILVFERLLPLCAFVHAYPNEVMDEWIHPHIQQFIACDERYQTPYIRSLAAYIKAGRNMQAAADALFIHKTSLIYRLKKMQEMAGPFLQQLDLLFMYEYSLRLLRYI